MPVLGSLAEIECVVDAARSAGRDLPALLHIDTGMSRLGLDARELRVLQQDHARLAGIDLRYVMTHLVSSEVPDDPLNERQLERFAAACAGLPPAPRSFANSSGIFLGPQLWLRPRTPGRRALRHQPHARPRPTRCAGGPAARARAGRSRHAAGRQRRLQRDLARRAAQPRSPRPASATPTAGTAAFRPRPAFFDGTPVPLVGRVSMDLTTFDVTDHPGIAPEPGWN